MLLTFVLKKINRIEVLPHIDTHGIAYHVWKTSQKIKIPVYISRNQGNLIHVHVNLRIKTNWSFNFVKLFIST